MNFVQRLQDALGAFLAFLPPLIEGEFGVMARGSCRSAESSSDLRSVLSLEAKSR